MLKSRNILVILFCIRMHSISSNVLQTQSISLIGYFLGPSAEVDGEPVK